MFAGAVRYGVEGGYRNSTAQRYRVNTLSSLCFPGHFPRFSCYDYRLDVLQIQLRNMFVHPQVYQIFLFSSSVCLVNFFNFSSSVFCCSSFLVSLCYRLVK